MCCASRPRAAVAGDLTSSSEDRAMTWVLVALIGFAGGVVSGLFGVGGAIVIVPGLVLLTGLDQLTANGTSLAALLLPVGILGALEYYRRGQVNVAYAAILAVGLLVGPLLGAKLAGALSEAALRRGFGGFPPLAWAKILLRELLRPPAPGHPRSLEQLAQARSEVAG